MAGTADKAALIAEIAATRTRLWHATEDLHQAMDFRARARRSFREHRGAWIGAAAVAGLLLFKMARRKRVVYVERSTGDLLGAAGKAGLFWTGAKLLAGLAKPMLGDLARTRVTQWAAHLAERRAAAAAELRRHR